MGKVLDVLLKVDVDVCCVVGMCNVLIVCRVTETCSIAFVGELCVLGDMGMVVNLRSAESPWEAVDVCLIAELRTVDDETCGAWDSCSSEELLVVNDVCGSSGECVDVGRCVLDEVYFVVKVPFVVEVGLCEVDKLCVLVGAPLVKPATNSRRKRCKYCMTILVEKLLGCKARNGVKGLSDDGEESKAQITFLNDCSTSVDFPHSSCFHSISAKRGMQPLYPGNYYLFSTVRRSS